jgi:PKHD-type hydroxylase
LGVPKNSPYRKPLQYTVYHAPYGKYDWHTDTADVNAPGDMAHRLMSFSVQLTDPTRCYKGGEFELIEELHDNFRSAKANENFNFDKKVTVSPFTQGSIVFFPSIVVHRVTPVTEGTRKSLVGWIEGSFI